MEVDHSSESYETAYVTHQCSIAEALKLISHRFDGDKRRLREFVKNVDVAFELVHPNKHEILLKFVKTKITGDAR
jgi:DNA polymerase/3'-5' exonuclease PolX